MRVFQYITVRAVLAAGTAFLFSVVFGPWVINQLRRLHLRQYERKEEAPPLYVLHSQKEGTPTMGGLLIIAAVVTSIFLWSRLDTPFVWLVLATLVYMGALGFADDLTKVIRKSSRGLGARSKLLLQLAWAAIALAAIMLIPQTRENALKLMMPFVKDPVITNMGLGLAFIYLAAVLIGSTNAVNLTDGLDGLAVGCSASVAFSYLVMSYVTGHIEFAEYLRIPFVDGSGELAVCCGSVLGSCLGFLWWNCHPASVFMGDTGSLALGGTIGIIAVLIKQELTLVVVGGVFVIEAVSVILQVAAFKLRGKRIFAMAPLHHHFEIRKWSETQVTVRFWILSIVFAILGILTLKIR
jgi:phospho-N-acetylmuramoyl-pentapeptide-transferase